MWRVKIQICFREFATLHEYISGGNAECALTAQNIACRHLKYRNMSVNFAECVDPNTSEVAATPPLIKSDCLLMCLDSFSLFVWTSMT